MTRAIAYLRVSTESQLDGFGLDIQRDAVVELAAAQGLTLVSTFTDEGISGSEGLNGRAQLAAALDDLCTYPGTTLLVPRLDRLARDLMIQEQVLADIWKTDAQVLSCSETERAYCHPDNPEDPARTLIRQVLGAVAQYERKMIHLRMTRGRRRRLAETGWAGGPRAYGCDAHEQAVLAHVEYQRRAGLSWRQVVSDLTKRGITKRSGRVWTAQELHRICTHATERALISPALYSPAPGS